MVVEEVTAKDRVAGEIRLRSEAMPFFASPDPLGLAPPDGLRGLAAKVLDPCLVSGVVRTDVSPSRLVSRLRAVYIRLSTPRRSNSSVAARLDPSL